MVIIEDTRQQKVPHNIAIRRYLEQQGYDVIRSKMLVGDYGISNKGNVVVDTKMDVSELYSDLIQDHTRFRNECIMAKRCGIQLYVLIPNKDGINGIRQIERWHNPQASIYAYKQRNGMPLPAKPPTANSTLIKIMATMESKYGVQFIFCPHDKVGEILVELLLQNPIQNAF